MSPKKISPIRSIVLLCLLAPAAMRISAADATPAPTPAAPAVALPPLPAPMNIPKPGATTDAPYQPQPILPGGVVVTLFPPDSPYLKQERIKEAEVYAMNNSAPGRFANITNIHNPSIEFHATTNRSLNTGMAVIVAAGGGHDTLNVGGESADFVHFFSGYGINTVILRNRLRSSGYNPAVDAVADAQQAIKIVRAYAKEWQLDPNKIGIMGFSAGAELAAPAAIKWAEFDAKNDVPGNPFAKISSRPDFAGIIYPGPTPFTPGRGRGGAAAPPFEPPAIPNNTPPSFIVCAGWGDRGHAIWADDWFRAMLNANVPNVEMHIYARGRHPGDAVNPGDTPSSGGLTDRGGIAFGTWHLRFIDWARDLEFMGKPGVETRAARDIAANIQRLANPPVRGGRGRGGRGADGAPSAPAAAAPAPSPAPTAK